MSQDNAPALPPGPWATERFTRVVCGVPIAGYLVRAADGSVVAEQFPRGEWAAHVDEKLARAIAAIPDLLALVREAAERLPGWAGVNDDAHGWHVRAKEAICKATGEDRR